MMNSTAISVGNEEGIDEGPICDWRPRKLFGSTAIADDEPLDFAEELEFNPLFGQIVADILTLHSVGNEEGILEGLLRNSASGGVVNPPVFVVVNPSQFKALKETDARQSYYWASHVARWEKRYGIRYPVGQFGSLNK